jgi:hypothetical protein
MFHNPLGWPRGSRKLGNMDTTDLRVFLYEATGLTASFAHRKQDTHHGQVCRTLCLCVCMVEVKIRFELADHMIEQELTACM